MTIEMNDFTKFLERQLTEVNSEEALKLAQIRDVIASSSESLQAKMNLIENIVDCNGRYYAVNQK